MQGPFRRQYGVQTTIPFQLRETDGLDLKVDAVHASGDTKLMKDEGDEANTANAFTDEGQGYSIVLTAIEMQAARVVGYIVDQGAKAWQDGVFIVETYGHYAHNSIWIDTVNGLAGTIDHVNGTVENPVDSIADANTLAASLGIARFEIAPGSSITFAAAQANQIFHGERWNLALGGQNVASSIFIGAAVSGVMAGTGTLQYFIDCIINVTSIIKATIFVRCLIASTITIVEAGEFLFDQCSSSVAGAGAPTFDFGSALNSSNLSVRHHSGGWKIENMGAGTGTYNSSFEGFGQIIWQASCSATSNVSIRGHWRITDNAGGAVTETFAGLNPTAVDEILDEVVDETITLREAVAVILSASAGLSSGGNTPNIKFRDVGDTKDRIDASVDSDGNRTAITIDGS